MRGRATDSKKDGGSSQEHYLAPELAHQLSHDVGRPGRSQNCEDRVEQWVSVGIFGWSTFRGKVNLRQENREGGRKRNSPIRPLRTGTGTMMMKHSCMCTAPGCVKFSGCAQRQQEHGSQAITTAVTVASWEEAMGNAAQAGDGSQARRGLKSEGRNDESGGSAGVRRWRCARPPCEKP